MPFDPDCAAFVARLRELNPPRYETLTPLQAREAMATARQAAALVPPAIAEIRDVMAETSGGSLRARLYCPAIDAELRAGTIDGNEARRRRRQLARESQSYGAMGGAMRFVKANF